MQKIKESLVEQTPSARALGCGIVVEALWAEYGIVGIISQTNYNISNYNNLKYGKKI